MNKLDFFQFHNVKNRLWVWLNGECTRLSLKEFTALPVNTMFNIEGSSNNYKIDNDKILIVP